MVIIYQNKFISKVGNTLGITMKKGQRWVAFPLFCCEFEMEVIHHGIPELRFYLEGISKP